jgi:hypothetical protein
MVSVNELVAPATSKHAHAHTAAMMTAVTAVAPTTRRRRGGMSVVADA